MSIIAQILEGWGRHISYAWFNIYNEKHKQIMEKRLEVCDSCSIRTKGICDDSKTELDPETGEIYRGCGCSIQAKSFVMENNVCPAGKWENVEF